MDHPKGLNLATIVSLATLVAMLGALVTWVFGFLATKSDLDSHKLHDSSVQAWQTYNFAANRLEYLDDKQAECQNKQLAHPTGLDPADAADCARYKAKYQSKSQEAADLKTKAMEATKEK